MKEGRARKGRTEGGNYKTEGRKEEVHSLYERRKKEVRSI